MKKPNRSAPAIKWLDMVEDHDYPAAASYLNLVYAPTKVSRIISRLRAAKIVEFKAKDIFRASELSLLGVSNSHVMKDTNKIREGKRLSPLLLVRDKTNVKLVIADGYHRLCAIYQFDEDALIRAKIA